VHQYVGEQLGRTLQRVARYLRIRVRQLRRRVGDVGFQRLAGNHALDTARLHEFTDTQCALVTRQPPRAVRVTHDHLQARHRPAIAVVDHEAREVPRTHGRARIDHRHAPVPAGQAGTENWASLKHQHSP
jgi:hypothetical protein